MDELLEQFLIEGRDLIVQASDDFAVLADDRQNAQALDSAFRAIHTLKGSVAVFALTPAEQVLHAAEDLLDLARKESIALDSDAISALVACLDQVDRWIDEMEDKGSLSANAAMAASRVIARLGRDAIVDIVQGDAPQGDGAAGWLLGLGDRFAEILDDTTEPLTAFRYTPDANCFFRGDDPATLVASVPGIVSLAVLPDGGAWPASTEIEPFTCFSIFEGLSTASLDIVRSAFRLVPDQVVVATLGGVRTATTDLDAGRGTRTGNVLRVDAARVDALADGLGELIVAINAVTPLADAAHRLDPRLAVSFRKAQAQLEHVTSQLHRTVTAVRSVPLDPALRRLPRLAREIAEGLDKRVSFTMSTGGLEVDKHIADGLFEPLLHLLRNAIDHGLETPDVRKKIGKAPDGQVSLTVRRDGDAIAVTLSDDGAGIDPVMIRQVAVAQGLIGAAEAEILNEAAALQLIFVPGFSTASAVTQVSGRGVGMDAVRDAIESVRGTIDVVSIPGNGATFRMRLPVSSLTTRLLVVEVGTERYGVSLDQVIETVRVDRAALMPVGLGIACILRGRTIPVLSLARLLGRVEQDQPNAKLVVTQSGGEPVALRVDGFAERIDTVVRPTQGVLASIPGVIGSALLGDGDVLLVLDLPELAA